MPEVLGVTFSEAWAEAAAIAPIDRAILVTLEFYHPAFIAPARVVADRVNLLATLESDAPRNAGEEVEFIALPVEVTLPEENKDGQAPSVSISIDNVSKYLTGPLDLALETLVPIQLIVREYASDDTSEPCRLPVIIMTVQSAVVTETRVTVQAAYTDPVNRGFPTRNYIATEYPGLIAA